MATKRVKISFQTVNDNRFTTIKGSVLSETNERVRGVMKGVVREYKKNETRSQQKASLLVLNA